MTYIRNLFAIVSIPSCVKYFNVCFDNLLCFLFTTIVGSTFRHHLQVIPRYPREVIQSSQDSLQAKLSFGAPYPCSCQLLVPL